MTGVSHASAPVEVREKVSFDHNACVVVLARLFASPDIEGCVALSTCNRTEIYGIASNTPDDAIRTVHEVLADISQLDEGDLAHLRTLTGVEVITHLFRVSSGLESMVLGEPQILGQVKSAYSTASDAGATGTTLNRLFHQAFRIAKHVRSVTAIGEGAVSVSIAAVELARSSLGALEGRSVVLVGAGKIGELCILRLADAGVARMVIVNRTIEKAEELSRKVCGEAAGFDDLSSLIAGADILITSVAATEPVITTEDITQAHGTDELKKLVVIDLGVPRNVESEATSVPGVTLYNIDDIEGVRLGNMDKRRQEAARADDIIRAEAESYRAWFSEREVVPVIRSLRNRCETIRMDELEKIRNRIPPETMEMLDTVTRRVVRKILHNPTIAMRATDDGDIRNRLIESVQDLFIRDPKDDTEETP